jgi:hypothetical protein
MLQLCGSGLLASMVTSDGVSRSSSASNVSDTVDPRLRMGVREFFALLNQGKNDRIAMVSPPQKKWFRIGRDYRRRWARHHAMRRFSEGVSRKSEKNARREEKAQGRLSLGFIGRAP